MMDFGDIVSLPANLGSKLVTLLVILLIGFGSGWYTKAQFVKAGERDQAVKQAVEVKKSVKKAVAKAQEIEVKAQEQAVVEKVRYKIIYREIQNHVPNNTPSFQSGTDCSRDVVSVGAVRMLNAALQNVDPDPADISDAEKQTPSPIGNAELSEKVTASSEQYYELARNHDDLVDYVTWLKEQSDK